MKQRQSTIIWLTGLALLLSCQKKEVVPGAGGKAIISVEVVEGKGISVKTGDAYAIKTNEVMIQGTFLKVATLAKSIIQHGHCWSSTQREPTINDDKTALGKRTSVGTFTSHLTKLKPNTQYYVRIYVKTANGEIGYNKDIQTFTTKNMASLPRVSLENISHITASGGRITAFVSNLQGRILNQYGFCWSDKKTSPTIQNNKYTLGNRRTDGSFARDITRLKPNTKYYVRGYLVYNSKTLYSNQVLHFVTMPAPDPTKIIYTNPANLLVGISNAVVLNNMITFLLGEYPQAGTVRGYPSANARWNQLHIANERGKVHTLENQSVAAYPSDASVAITRQHKLGIVYRKPTGAGYGFKMPYKIWNGTRMQIQEYIFTNHNWGAWGRLKYTNQGQPIIASFAHAGYALMLHNKSSHWMTRQGTAYGTYIADLQASYYHQFYISGRANNQLYLYWPTSQAIGHQKIANQVRNNCDLKVHQGSFYALYFTQSSQLVLSKNVGSRWQQDLVTTTQRINHKASVFITRTKKILVAYQTDRQLVVLERQANGWHKVFEKTGLLRNNYGNYSHHPTMLYKNNRLYIVYADARHVYLTPLNGSL